MSGPSRQQPFVRQRSLSTGGMSLEGLVPPSPRRMSVTPQDAHLTSQLQARMHRYATFALGCEKTLQHEARDACRPGPVGIAGHALDPRLR